MARNEKENWEDLLYPGHNLVTSHIPERLQDEFIADLKRLHRFLTFYLDRLKSNNGATYRGVEGS